MGERKLPRRRFALIALLALVLALVASACGGGNDEGTSGGGSTDTGQGGAVTKGGIYRMAGSSYEFTGGFDPTGEYLGTAFGLYSNLLLRTLVGYKHVSGAAGNEIVPDLATDAGELSEDGLTYTFTLKDGVMFGPPVSRPITSKDIAYAFERIGTEALVAQYGFYYTVIKGMAEFTAGDAKTISGIETPDDKTIKFTLTQPTGDFLYRLAMPAAAPMPPEVGKCFKKAGEYGRTVVSSGPYMIKGSDKADASSCQTLKPFSGFDPTRDLSFVRNPDYDQATDDTRENNVDGFDYSLNTNIKDIFNKIEAGELDGEIEAEPAEVLRKYSTTSDLKDRLKIGAGDRTWYITMNLTQPPFDDIHVRKALNWVMDKAGFQRAWGGPTKGAIANHIVPDTMFNGDLDDYAPYGTENDAGDVDKAKEEMKQSKYDTNQDGMCDAPECSGVLFVNRNTPPWTDMEPIIEQGAAKVGIKLNTREFEDAYPVIQDTGKKVPVSAVPGWGKDYADPSTFMVLFDSRSILPQGNVNYSLVGLTPELAKKDKIEGTLTDIPSIDADIDKCNVLLDAERLTCWEDMDKNLMENIVPWVPYLDATNVDTIGPAVSKYEYDQFSGTTAYSRVAVDVSKQK